MNPEIIHAFFLMILGGFICAVILVARLIDVIDALPDRLARSKKAEKRLKEEYWEEADEK